MRSSLSNPLGFVTAFLGGIASFLSPCVLPLIPGYLSFITGLSASELADEERSLWKVAVPSLLFIAGFSLVFILMGASASIIGEWLMRFRDVVRIVGGILVIAFGIFMLDVIRIPGLYREVRFDLAKTRRFGRFAAPLLGIAFAAGWTPCVGPILASILGIAGSTGSATQGMLLLATYSAGLGIPFLALALFFGKLRPVTQWLVRHSRTISVVAGILMIVTGLLIVFGKMGLLTGVLARILPVLG